MLVRQMRESDIFDIYEIEQLCFKDPYSFSFLSDLIKAYHKMSLVAEENNKVIGFIITRIEWDGRGHILSFAVHPEFQDKGIGTKLLFAAVNNLFHYIDEIYLEVRKSNTKAIKLYKKIGFKESHIAPKYYPNGEDALVMHLKKIEYPYKALLLEDSDL
ncbi:MAG: ribosomal protein S18-alanine N-acetyltransferase [Candidatus Asgardarchaeia archaeon]